MRKFYLLTIVAPAILILSVCAYLLWVHAAPVEPELPLIVQDNSTETGAVNSAPIAADEVAGEAGMMESGKGTSDVAQAAAIRLQGCPVERVEENNGAVAADYGWEGGQILSVYHSRAMDNGVFRKVTLVQPADLPYPVRVEEIIAPAAENPDEAEVLQRTEIVANRFLVKLRPDMGEAQLAAILAKVGGRLERRISRTGIYRVELAELTPDGVPESVRILSSKKSTLLYAEPDFIARTQGDSDDPKYIDGTLWGLHNTGQDSGTDDADIDAPEAWGIRSSAAGVVVAVIDTGVNHRHEDLAGNMWINTGEIPDNGTDDDGNGFVDDVHGINAITLTGDPMDDAGHGSHVSGTIGAVGNNGTGLSGLVWDVQIMGCKFISSRGGGSFSDAIICIEYAVDNGARVLNNSWGGGSFQQALEDVIRYAMDNGVIFVAAAGNWGTDNDPVPVYPTSHEVANIVSVAATDRNDSLATFSDYGLGSVNIAAPGVSIYSADAPLSEDYDTYSIKNGTSMASPHVAGALALLIAQFPEDAWYETINRLYNGVDVLPGLVNKTQTSGRLNLFNSLTTEHARPINDDFESPLKVTQDVAYIRTSTYGATRQQDEPMHGGEPDAGGTIWFEFVAPADGLVGIEATAGEVDPLVVVYQGASLAALTEVSLSQPAPGRYSFVGVEGESYRIALSARDGIDGLAVLRLSGPPANNDLSKARLFSSVGEYLIGSNINATKEDGEPDHAGHPGGASIWYKWVAETTNRVAVSTLFSRFDTLLAVYEGPADNPSLGDLVLVGENDNAVGGNHSYVKFQAVQGRAYYFAVDGKNSSTGNAVISLLLPPPNDDFTDSLLLRGLKDSGSSTAISASKEAGEPDHNGKVGGESVWWRWTAPEAGSYIIDTRGSYGGDPVIGVYTGNSVDDLLEIGSDDDGGGALDSQVVFEAAAGTVYHIAVDNIGSTHLYDIKVNIEKGEVPANDKFADAAALIGLDSTYQGSNFGASLEPGDDFGGSASVWFKWTAPANLEMGLYVDGIDFNPFTDVYTGTELNSLVRVGRDLFSGIGWDTFNRWQAVAGQTYYFRIAGLAYLQTDPDIGSYILTLKEASAFAAPNDMIADAIEITERVIYSYRTWNYGASHEFGEPNHANGGGSNSIWWKWTCGPGEGGPAVATNSVTRYNARVAVYIAADPANPQTSALTLVADNREAADERYVYSTAEWNAAEGTTYFIAVDGRPDSRGQDMGTGRVIFSFQHSLPNDDFADAKLLEGEIVSDIGYNMGASIEDNEPKHGGNVVWGISKRSLWWKWTAPDAGLYQIDTIGSTRDKFEDSIGSSRFTTVGMDTRMSVYSSYSSNLSLGSLIRLADSSVIANPSREWPDSIHRNSRVLIRATAGRTYYIAVDGDQITGDDQGNPAAGTQIGEIKLNIKPFERPANDDFEDAREVAGTYLRDVVSNYGATRQPFEQQHGITNGASSLWWKWTAPETGQFFATSAGNHFDDLHSEDNGIAVYTGTTLRDLVKIAVAGDKSEGLRDYGYTGFYATKGVTYFIAVDSPGGIKQGSVCLMISRPPDNDNFANAREMVGSRWVDAGHNIGATPESGEPVIDLWRNHYNFRSVWWKWTSPMTGTVKLDTINTPLGDSDIWAIMSVYTGNSVDSLTRIAADDYHNDPNNNDLWLGKHRLEKCRPHMEFNAVAGTTYYIQIDGAGYDNAAVGPIFLELIGPPGIPETPSEFVAQRTNKNQVDLAWRDNAVDEDTYIIERSTTESGPWEVLFSTNRDEDSYTDLTVHPGTKDYYYRLHAEGVGGVSEAVIASTLDAAPQAFNVEIDGTPLPGFVLKGNYTYYDMNGDPESGSAYRWLRADSEEGPFIPIAGAIGSEYELTSAENGKHVAFQVVPANSGNPGVGDPVASQSLLIGADTEANLLVHYLFDEVDGSSGILDQQGNHDGILDGAALREESFTGTALKFDGTQRITVPLRRSFNEITVAFWMRGGESMPKTQALAWARNPGGNDSLVLAPGFNNGERIICRMGHDGVVYDELSGVNLDSTGYLSKWNHWVFVKNVLTGRMTIYRNGVIFNNNAARVAQVNTDSAVTNGIVIGFYNDGYFEGDLEDYRIYDRALSQLDVLAIYATTDPTLRVLEVPPAPLGLTLSTSGTDGIRLEWSHASTWINKEDTFSIERSADGLSGWTEIDVVEAGSVSYIDSSISLGDAWYYRVKAVNEFGASGYSNVEGRTFGLTFAEWAASFGVDDIYSEVDGDGIPALQEYALALDPSKKSEFPVMVKVEATGEGEGSLVIEFIHRLDTLDLYYVVEASDRPDDWSNATVLWSSDTQEATYVTDTISNGDGTEIISIRYPHDIGQDRGQYLRLLNSLTETQP